MASPYRQLALHLYVNLDKHTQTTLPRVALFDTHDTRHRGREFPDVLLNRFGHRCVHDLPQRRAEYPRSAGDNERTGDKAAQSSALS